MAFLTPSITMYAGIALLMALAGTGLHSCYLQKNVEVAESKQAEAEISRDAFKVAVDNTTQSLASERAAHGTTKTSLQTMQTLLDDCQETRESQIAAAAKAQRRLAATLSAATKATAAIDARYKAATKDPECSICIGRPVCAALKVKP